MKKCPYCGTQYADDVTVCVCDGESLDVGTPPPSAVADDQAKPYLAYPQYQWTALDGWKCIGMLVVFWFLLRQADHLIYLFFPGFYWSGFGELVLSVLYYTVEILVAAYFARTETLATFWQGFGLDRRPTELVGWGVLMALFIRFVGHSMRAHGWGAGIHNADLDSFRATPGLEKYLYLVPPLVLAPLFEESIYRGFLFKAFRRSYSVAASMAIVVLWAAWSHRRYYLHSWTAAVDLSALTVVQCYLREKSPSLWDSILCHFAFNLSMLFFITD